MAHKKGVGSSKNGRESAKLVTSLYVREVQFTILVTILAWVVTTLCMHWLMVSFALRRDVKTEATFLLSPQRHKCHPINYKVYTSN